MQPDCLLGGHNHTVIGRCQLARWIGHTVMPLPRRVHGDVAALPATSMSWVTPTFQSTHRLIKKNNSFFHLSYTSADLHFNTRGSPGAIHPPMFSHHECRQAAVEKPLPFQLLLCCCQIPALPWPMCSFLIYMGFAHSWILVLPVTSIILIILLLIFQINIRILQYSECLQSQWRYWDYSQGSSYKGVLSSFSSSYTNLRPI